MPTNEITNDKVLALDTVNILNYDISENEDLMYKVCELIKRDYLDEESIEIYLKIIHLLQLVITGRISSKWDDFLQDKHEEKFIVKFNYKEIIEEEQVKGLFINQAGIKVISDAIIERLVEIAVEDLFKKQGSKSNEEHQLQYPLFLSGGYFKTEKYFAATPNVISKEFLATYNLI
jgi:hypothetical protein